jgi:hypothetical protein
MTAAIVPYGPTSAVESMADAARLALGKHGHRVIAAWDVDDPDGEPAVWVIPRDRASSAGQYFRPGQQLVVAEDGSYRILPVSAVAA